MIFLFYALICDQENHAQRCASVQMDNFGTISSNFAWTKLNALNVPQTKFWKNLAARLKTATRMSPLCVRCPCQEVDFNITKFSNIFRIMPRNMRVPKRTQVEWKEVR